MTAPARPDHAPRQRRDVARRWVGCAVSLVALVGVACTPADKRRERADESKAGQPQAPGSQPLPPARGEPHVTTDDADVCAQTARALRSGDFTEFAGLPSGCTAQDLGRALDAVPVPGRQVHVGEKTRTATVHMISIPEYSTPIEALVVEGALVRVDVEYPQLAGGLDAHHTALGEPATRLSYYWDVVHIPDGLLLWPDRGLALFVSKSGSKVNRVALFAPTTADGFRDQLARDLRSYEEDPR